MARSGAAQSRNVRPKVPCAALVVRGRCARGTAQVGAGGSEACQVPRMSAGIDSASPTQKKRVTSSARADERRQLRIGVEDEVIRIEPDLGAAPRSSMAIRPHKLHVGHLVEREAGGEGDEEVDRGFALQERAQRRRARDPTAVRVLLERRPRVHALRDASSSASRRARARRACPTALPRPPGACGA